MQRILTARHDALGIEHPVAGVDFRVQGFRFDTGESLQYAEIALPESRLEYDLMVRAGGNTPRSFMRTPQIAAVKRSEGFSRQPLRQSFSLGNTGIAQRSVKMPLNTVLPVPHGFAMAKQDDAADGHFELFRNR